MWQEMIEGIMVKALLNDIPGDQFPSHLGLFISIKQTMRFWSSYGKNLQ
jgi:hypothetical protein